MYEVEKMNLIVYFKKMNLKVIYKFFLRKENVVFEKIKQVSR